MKSCLRRVCSRLYSMLYPVIHPVLFVVPYILCISVAFPSISFAITPQAALAQIKQIDPNAAVILGDGVGKNSKKLIDLNAQDSYIPASTLKIPLVLSAHRILGKDFRFSTDFHSDKNNNLVIKGRGDPFLTSEEVGFIAANLKRRGYSDFNGILLDDKLFQGLVFHGLGQSQNPYDAKFSSLLVNFNTVNLQLARSTDKQYPGVSVVSAEKQTPTLPLMLEIGASMDLQCCNKAERINLQANDDYRRQYVAQLFRSIFSTYGIRFRDSMASTGGYKSTQVSRRQKLIYTHYNSRTMADVSEQLLLYSNNLIAMGVLLQFAPNARNPIKSSIGLWHKDLATLKHSGAKTIINEPSGLDRRNKMTADKMYAVLLAFTKHSALLPTDAPSPTMASYKTGTLTGVYNLAGYINTKGVMRPFVIFTENPINNRNNILGVLKRVD